MLSFCFMSRFTSLSARAKNLGLAAMLATTLPFIAPGQAMAESGVNDNRILLGQSAAFSGPAAQLGIQLHTGAKVYFDALNERGGVNGRKVEIITADDKYEPELAAWNTKKLIETDDVFALFGYVGTPTSNAAVPIFTKAKVPFFAPFTGAQSLREPFSREIFHIRSSYNDETEHLVRGLVNNGMKNIAVFYQDDAYGKAGLAGVERALKLFNLPMPVTATVARNSTDVKAAVNKILPTKPDAIIQVSTYTTCAAFVQAMRSSNYMGFFYNLSFVGSQALADALGDAGAGTVISQVVPFPWGQGTPVVAEFHKAMKKAGKEKDINFSSLEGYIAAKIFTEGLRRTGRDLTRQRFIRALETIDSNDYDAGGFTVHFSPTNHNGSRFVDMTAISKNNKFSH